MPRGWNEPGKWSWWNIGASIASCRLAPPTRWRSRNSDCHWSCWSPPGDPHARTGAPSRSDQRGGERRARPQARREGGREPLVEPEHLRPAAEAEARAPGSSATRAASRRSGSRRSCCPSGRRRRGGRCRPRRRRRSRSTVGSPVVASVGRDVASPASRRRTCSASRGSRPPGEPGRKPRSACRRRARPARGRTPGRAGRRPTRATRRRTTPPGRPSPASTPR